MDPRPSFSALLERDPSKQVNYLLVNRHCTCYSKYMRMIPKKLTDNQLEILTDICITSSQVTFGVSYATLFLPPLDQVKQLAIIVSTLATVLLWFTALYFASKRRKIL